MMRTYEKEGRKYFVQFGEKREVFVATRAYFSHIAAQMLVSQQMASLKWKPLKRWMIIPDEDGNECIAVGFRVPLLQSSRAEKILSDLFHAA